MCDLDKTIRERRSIRGFQSKQVPQDVMDEVFALAQHAPSNCNVQPWRAYVASGEACESLRKDIVASVMGGTATTMVAPMDKFEGGYRDKQIACAVELYGSMGIARDDKQGRAMASLRNFQFFDAPHVAYITMSKNFGVGVALDVGMYVQSLMLAMWSRGIGACAQASLRAFPDVVAKHLDIPEDEQILCGLSFGYEDIEVAANKSRQPRAPLSENIWFKN